MPRKGQGRITGNPVTTTTPNPAGGVKLETFIPSTLMKRGTTKQIITPIEAPEAFRVEAVQERRDRKAAKDTPLIRALGLAHYWQHLLDSGKVGSLSEIAVAEGMDLGQVSRIARLARLAQWVVEKCLAGGGNGCASKSPESNLACAITDLHWCQALLIVVPIYPRFERQSQTGHRLLMNGLGRYSTICGCFLAHFGFLMVLARLGQCR